MKMLKGFILTIVACCILPFTGEAQMEQQPVGAATSVIFNSVISGTYTVTCNFVSFKQYSAGSIQVGDTYSVEYSLSTPKTTVRFEITNVTIVSGSQVQLEMEILDGASIIAFPTTNAVIYRQTSNFSLAQIEANLSEFLKAGLLNHNFIVLDSIINNIGGSGQDTSLASFDLGLDEQRLVDGVYSATARINWDSINQFYQSDTFSVKADNEFLAQSDSVRLKTTDGGIMLHTPGIEAGSRNEFAFFILQDPVTGRGEWDDLSKYETLDGNTDSLYFAYGLNGVDSIVMKNRRDTVWMSEGGGSSFSEYELLSGDVTVVGSSGITAAFASGEWTITVPLNGVILGYSIDVEASDATYSNGTISDAVKITVDNTANGTTLRGASPVFMARTAAGAITSGNPLQYNTAINTSSQIDEFTAGITSFIFQQVSTNASAGGVVSW